MIRAWLKRYRLVLVLVLIGLVLLTFLGIRQSQKKTTLWLGTYAGSSWDVPSGQEYQFLDRVIRRFEKAHPNVEVKYESGITKEDYSSWLSSKIVAGQQPDVFIVPENDFNLLASTGALANLDGNVKRDIQVSDFYQTPYLSGEYEKTQYALPFESNPVMMCINIDLLKKEGIDLPKSSWTLTDFYEICQKVTKDTNQDGVIDQYGSFGYGWEDAIAAYGISLFNASGTESYFNTPEVRKALSLITKLEALNDNYQVTLEDFDEGRVAFYPMTLAQYRTYKPYPYHVSKYSSFSWSCVAMPSQEAGISHTQTKSSLYAISSKSAHADLAWEFLKLLTYDKESQQELFKMSQGVSVLTSVMKSKESREILQNDNFGATALSLSTLDGMMKESILEPKFKSYNTIYEKADYLISQSLEQNTIDNDLADIQKEIEDNLK